MVHQMHFTIRHLVQTVQLLHMTIYMMLFITTVP